MSIESVNESFTDAQNNHWVWDGEEYVVLDDNDTKWVYQNDRWLAKGTDGYYYESIDGDWVITDLEGRHYAKNSDDEIVPMNELRSNSKMMNRKNSEEPKSHQNENRSETFGSHESLRHSHRPHKHEHRHKSHHHHHHHKKNGPVKLREQIVINTNIDPKRTDENYLRNSVFNAQSQGADHTPEKMIQEYKLLNARRDTRLNSDENNAYYVRPPLMRRSQPVYVNNDSRESFFSDKLKGFFSKFSRSKSDLTDMSVDETNRQEGDSETKKALANNDTSDFMGIATKFLDNYDILDRCLTMPTTTDASPRNSDSASLMGMKRPALHALLNFVREFEKLPKAKSDSDSDILLRKLMPVVKTLVQDNIEAIDRLEDKSLNRYWSPKDAYKADAILYRCEIILQDAEHLVSSCEERLRSACRELILTAGDPDTNSGTTVQNVDQFREEMCRNLSLVFDTGSKLRDLIEEVKTVEMHAEQLAASNKDCPCRPSREQMQKENLLKESTIEELRKELSMVKNKLVVEEVRIAHFADRATALEAQLKVLLDTGTYNSEVRRIIEFDLAEKRKTRSDMEERVRKLEQLYKSNKVYRRLGSSTAPGNGYSNLAEICRRVDAEESNTEMIQPNSRLEQLLIPKFTVVTPQKVPVIPAIHIKMDRKMLQQELETMLKEINETKNKSGATSEFTNDNLNRIAASISASLNEIKDNISNRHMVEKTKNLSKQLDAITFKELPENLRAEDSAVLRQLQAMGQRLHNLTLDLTTAEAS